MTVKKYTLVIISLLISVFSFADTKISAESREIAENIDLNAITSMFGDSENLMDFEYRINNPNYKISNLDLNDDGEVDYLRVLESGDRQTRIISIQAVIGNNLYQDVATIEVEKDSYGKIQMQVVGNSYLFGNNYIIQPAYNYRPNIFAVFWGKNYRFYISNYHWNRYPRYWRPWHPVRYDLYRDRVSFNINHRNKYKRIYKSKLRNARKYRNITTRNDYGTYNHKLTNSQKAINDLRARGASTNFQQPKRPEIMTPPNTGVLHPYQHLPSKTNDYKIISPEKAKRAIRNRNTRVRGNGRVEKNWKARNRNRVRSNGFNDKFESMHRKARSNLIYPNGTDRFRENNHKRNKRNKRINQR